MTTPQQKVSAERSDAKAQASFKTLQSRYPHVLGRRSPLIRRVELGEKGIFYRAQIGAFRHGRAGQAGLCYAQVRGRTLHGTK
jgi:hypothetical protein